MGERHVTRSIERDQRLVAAEGAHARRFDDEMIVLDLQGGDYYGLNAVGARLWEEFTAGRTPAQVAATLVAAYDVDFDRALNDCLALANELCARGLLRKG